MLTTFWLTFSEIYNKLQVRQNRNQKYFIEPQREIGLCYNCSTKNRNTQAEGNLIIENIIGKVYFKKICALCYNLYSKERSQTAGWIMQSAIFLSELLLRWKLNISCFSTICIMRWYNKTLSGTFFLPSLRLLAKPRYSSQAWAYTVSYSRKVYTQHLNTDFPGRCGGRGIRYNTRVSSRTSKTSI